MSMEQINNHEFDNTGGINAGDVGPAMPEADVTLGLEFFAGLPDDKIVVSEIYTRMKNIEVANYCRESGETPVVVNVVNGVALQLNGQLYPLRQGEDEMKVFNTLVHSRGEDLDEAECNRRGVDRAAIKKAHTFLGTIPVDADGTPLMILGLRGRAVTTQLAENLIITSTTESDLDIDIARLRPDVSRRSESRLHQKSKTTPEPALEKPEPLYVEASSDIPEFCTQLESYLKSKTEYRPKFAVDPSDDFRTAIRRVISKTMVGDAKGELAERIAAFIRDLVKDFPPHSESYDQ